MDPSSGFHNEIEDHYAVPFLAKVLHSLPHFNISFQRQNSTFRLNEIYLESLGIWACLPAGLLIISLFGLLLYLMTRCCDRNQRNSHSITSLKIVLSMITVLCCGAIGVALYGNDDLHNSLVEVLTSGKKIFSVVESIRNATHALEFTLTGKIRPNLIELADIFETPVNNQTALRILISSLDSVSGNCSVAGNACMDIRRPISGIAMSHFLMKGDQYELIRWPGTVAVLALLLVLCAVLLVGVARHSRCALILFSVCGLLAVTGSWLMSGIYLAASIGTGDLCVDPDDFLVEYKPNGLSTDILLFYLKCETSSSNPFTQRLRDAAKAIQNARNSMNTVAKISQEIFKSAGLQPKLGSVLADLNISERLLTGLTAIVDCKAIHFNYLNATRNLCEGGLLGLVLMLIASFIAATLLTIMVYVVSHTWIYSISARKNQEQYVNIASQQQQQQQQQAQNHYHPTMPRPQPNGPPVISGSHTLQHPSKNKHQEMMAPHYHHAMGTHTLGRMGHNQSLSTGGSPKHLTGPNNDHQHPQAIAVNTTSYQQQHQQQQIYYQQQMQYQTLRRRQQQQAQAQQQYQQQGQQPMQQPPMPQHQMQQYQQQQQQQMPRQQLPPQSQPQSIPIAMPVQSQPNVLSSISIQQTSIPPHLLNNNNAIYVQSKLPPPAQDLQQSAMVTSMPSNAIYVQSKPYVDGGTKQYGTLKFGTKYDPMRQPGNSIPVVVPTIPKYNQNVTTNAQPEPQQSQNCTVPVQARPLPQIPQNEFQNQKDSNYRFYTQKRVGKNVPIPKIENFTSLNNNNNNHETESKTSTFAPIAVSVAPTTTTTDVNQNQNQAALQPQQVENNKMDEEYPSTNTINSNDYAITSL